MDMDLIKIIQGILMATMIVMTIYFLSPLAFFDFQYLIQNWADIVLNTRFITGPLFLVAGIEWFVTKSKKAKNIASAVGFVFWLYLTLARILILGWVPVVWITSLAIALVQGLCFIYQTSKR